jgi:Ca2+-binding RTX toxin-like protein
MAETVNWSDLQHGVTYTDVELYDEVGNPDGIILHFDTPSYIDPYDLELLANDDLSIITVIDLTSGKTVTFHLDGLTVTPDNVTFAGGGVLLVGDGEYGTDGDNAGKHLIAGDDWDQLVGLGGDDTLDGGLGNDVFTDRSGANMLSGGGGNDFFYVYQDIGSSSTVTGGEGRDFYYLDYESPALLAAPGGPGNDYMVTDFEFGPDGDVIYTSDLVYLAIGYEDEDPFEAGFLRFVYDEGTDTLFYQGDRDGAAGLVHDWMTLITLRDVGGVEAIPAANLPDLLIGTDLGESLVGTARGDLMTALGGSDAMDGLAGKDYLAGGLGNDVLNGGAGVDTMRGGAGNDTYWVDKAGDTLIETSDPGALVLPGESDAGYAGSKGDTVIAAINYALKALFENLELIGAASRGTGNGLANNIKGNAGADTLSGAGGNDTLDGGSGNDLLLGGTGNDRLTWGANVNDRFDGGGDTDTLRTTSSLNLTLVGNSNIKNVEQIDLTAAGKQKLTLNVTDVLDLSGSTNTIKVLGTSDDVVDIVGSFTRGSVSGNFRSYKVGTGILQIDTDVLVS